MISLFILLRTSLKATFVKGSSQNKCKRVASSHRQFITRESRFHVTGDFRARCRCVIFARLSLRGEIAGERTQAFILPKENDRSSNLPRCTVISLDYQLHVTVDSPPIT